MLVRNVLRVLTVLTVFSVTSAFENEQNVQIIRKLMCADRRLFILLYYAVVRTLIVIESIR